MNLDVLDVNAFEIRGLDYSIRGVYPLTAMMNSVCNPNTQVQLLFSLDFKGEDSIRLKLCCLILQLETFQLKLKNLSIQECDDITW